MALLLLGKSPCGLCGELLLAGQDLVGLPALADTGHPLYAYFDQGFHRRCFAQWQHREAALAAVRADQQRPGSRGPRTLPPFHNKPAQVV